MADDGATKKRTFRKFTYRGVDLDQLLDMSTDDLVDLFPARARRKCVHARPCLRLQAATRLFAQQQRMVACVTGQN
jgi:transcriptional regulator GlxA family with amidase domain